MLTVDRHPQAALPASAPAQRGTSARWRDPRLIGGIALVVVAVAAGAVLLGARGGGSTVVRATRDLPAGVAVSQADLETVMADLPDPSAYLAEPRAGDVVVRPVRAGELVPADALAPTAPLDVRLVTVPVEPLHAPPVLAAGAHVDVWVTGDAEGAVPQLALANAMVASVSTETDNSTGQWAVVLQVPPADAARIVAASQGSVDLVARPEVEAGP